MKAYPFVDPAFGELKATLSAPHVPGGAPDHHDLNVVSVYAADRPSRPFHARRIFVAEVFFGPQSMLFVA